METIKTDNLEQLEARLRSAMDAARAAGYKIRQSVFVVKYDDKKECCAIGAVQVTDPVNPWPKDDRGSVMYANQELGLTDIEVSNFTSGFDGLDLPPFDPRPEYYELGKKLAKEYVDG